MSTSIDQQSDHELYRLLRGALDELRGACRDGVHDPYQCYHWNSIATITQTIETLNSCLKVVEGRLGPDLGDTQERAAFLAQFETNTARA